MKAIKKDRNRYISEHTENLMLLTLFAEQSVRHEAIAELRKRRSEQYSEAMAESYCTNMSIIPC